MNDDQEILVHISAPTTRRADEVYHSLTAAYLDFEPYEPGAHWNTQNRRAGHSGPVPGSIITATPAQGSRHQASQSLGDTTTSKDSYGSFPSHFSSRDHDTSQQSSEHSTRLDSVEDSTQPTSRIARLERVQARWRAGRTSGTSFLSGRRSNIQSPGPGVVDDSAFIEDSQLAAQAIQSELPEHYSTTSEDTSDDDADLITNVQPSPAPNKDYHLRTVISPDKEALQPRDRSVVSESRMKLRPRTSLRTTHVASSAVAITKDSTTLEDAVAAKAPKVDFRQLPLQVYPPAPQVTVESPGSLPSQVTRYLRELKLHNPKRFKPTKRLRKVDADERGYWLVDCARWSADAQYGLWTSLAEDIHNGKLGWAVTLHRDSSSRNGIGPLQLYCWGEIVEHIWLSLWLASSGKISGSGLKWFDAEDKVVFEVP